MLLLLGVCGLKREDIIIGTNESMSDAGVGGAKKSEKGDKEEEEEGVVVGVVSRLNQSGTRKAEEEEEAAGRARVLQGMRGIHRACVCVCVCVREKESMYLLGGT